MNMNMKIEKCGATCPDQRGGPDFVCELKKGHKCLKHSSDAGGYWNDAGADRLKLERQLKEPIQGTA